MSEAKSKFGRDYGQQKSKSKAKAERAIKRITKTKQTDFISQRDEAKSKLSKSLSTFGSIEQRQRDELVGQMSNTQGILYLNSDMLAAAFAMFISMNDNNIPETKEEFDAAFEAVASKILPIKSEEEDIKERKGGKKLKGEEGETGEIGEEEGEEREEGEEEGTKESKESKESKERKIEKISVTSKSILKLYEKDPVTLYKYKASLFRYMRRIYATRNTLLMVP
jgi:hypothetical protein